MAEELLKETEGQAVAAWIEYLNQFRFQDMINNINENRVFNLANLKASLEIIEKHRDIIYEDVINKGAGRGGQKGMHGFIAEIAEVGVSKAREKVKGIDLQYEWVNDNGPADLIRNGVEIQQKFVNAGGHLSLEAVKKHLAKYPEYIQDGHKYQIPKDHFEKIKEYLNMPQDVANRMSTENGDFSLRQWKEVNEFCKEYNITSKNIDKNDFLEPSKLEYRKVQKGTIDSTLDNEKKELKNVSKKITQDSAEEIKVAHKASFGEGIKVATFAAVSEGAVTFVATLTSKAKEKKGIKNITKEEWEEIFSKTGISGLKGGARGITVYALTNLANSPAAVANAVFTASLGAAEQIHLYREGKISEQDFLINSEMLYLDASVSALSSIVGQVVVPVPVLGAIIGNTVGTLVYKTTKGYVYSKEEQLIKQYLEELKQIDELLDEDYKECVELLNEEMEEFLSLLELAFSPDIDICFKGSIDLAISMGVPTEEILDTKEKVDDYFMN